MHLVGGSRVDMLDLVGGSLSSITTLLPQQNALVAVQLVSIYRNYGSFCIGSAYTPSIPKHLSFASSFFISKFIWDTNVARIFYKSSQICGTQFL